MIYKKSNFKIISDFKVKEIQKDKYNVDLIIEVGYRCVNLYFDNLPNYIKSRIQFPSVKSIFIRFCIIEDNNICTVHFLNDSGIHSTMANFEIDYSQIYMEVRDKEFSVDIKIMATKSSFLN